MTDMIIQFGGKDQPAETEFYNKVHVDIESMAGRMTPAQINGIMEQIKLEVLGVFEDGEFYCE